MKKFILLLLLPSVPIFALSESHVFTDPKQQQAFEQLSREFRCVTCANQNIGDSFAPVAKAMQEDISLRIRNGESTASIREHLLASYGDYVVYSPPLKKQTYFLWGMPFLMLILGLFLWVRFFNTKQEMV